MLFKLFLRNDTSVRAAAEAAARGDLEKAVDHIQQSQKPIDEVVGLLVLCDKSPTT